jgi:hypothetical protein
LVVTVAYSSHFQKLGRLRAREKLAPKVAASKITLFGGKATVKEEQAWRRSG